MKSDINFDIVEDRLNPVTQFLDKLAARIVTERYALVPSFMTSDDFDAKAELEYEGLIDMFVKDNAGAKLESKHLSTFMAVKSAAFHSNFQSAHDALDEYLDKRQRTLVNQAYSLLALSEKEQDSSLVRRIEKSQAMVVDMFERLGMEVIRTVISVENIDDMDLESIRDGLTSDLESVVDIRKNVVGADFFVPHRRIQAVLNIIPEGCETTLGEVKPAIPGCKDIQDLHSYRLQKAALSRDPEFAP